MSLPLPDSHLDLLTRPHQGVLTSMIPDGQLHSSLVWCDSDGVCARVNTTRQRQKGRNMLANPKVCLLVVDPQNTARYLEIRGAMELIEAGAREHLDQVTRQYSTHPHYYGSNSPVQQAQETRIICRIHATKITRDAIHT
jgi:PPOX class probable F420-dependent enzyme